MKDPRSIEGRWQIFGPRKGSHYGVLTYDPESGLNLTVKIAKPGQLAATLASSSKKRKHRGVIQGYDRYNNPITLFGCGQPGTSSSIAYAEYQIHAIYCLIGGHFKSWSHAKFKSVFVEYSLLNNWLGRSAIKQEHGADGLGTVSISSPPDIIIQIDAVTKLTITTSVGMQSSFASEYRLTQNHIAQFEVQQPQPPGTLLDGPVLKFRRLLTLLSGSLVFSDSIKFFSDGADVRTPVEFLCSNSGVAKANRSTHQFNMLVQHSEMQSTFPTIVQKWFKYHERLDSVLNLYFAVVSNPTLYANHEFLFLAQALEVYHSSNPNFTSSIQPLPEFRKRIKLMLDPIAEPDRDWLKEKLNFANQKTLAERLEDIIDANKAELIQFVEKPAKFAEVIRHTRNFYTHFDKKLQRRGKVAGFDATLLLSWQMRALLEICVLKDLGVNGPPIQKIINRFKRVTFFSV